MIGPTRIPKNAEHAYSCSVHLIFLCCALLLFLSRCLSAQTATLNVKPTDELAQARASLDHGQYADADKELRNYLTDHAADVEAQYLLAFALFREDKPADSLKEYTDAARQRRPGAADLKTVALDYVLLNDYHDAEHWIRYALSMDANDPEAWYEAGRIEYTLNYFRPALEAFQRSLQLDSTSVKAENNLGLTLEGLNRVDDAIAAYRKALAMQAGSAHPSEQPMLNLATVLVDRNQLDEALSLLQQAQQIAPNDWRILAQLGRLYTERGDLNAARDVLERAVEIEPQKASLHFQLGQVYKKSGSAEKAQTEFALTQKLLGTSASSPK
jgi:tetratricopeptide (TPR) repeat protein